MSSTETPMPEEEEQTGLGVQSTTTEARNELPDIPSVDLSSEFASIITPSPEQDKIQKRASNVMKLAQENEKLGAELKAVTDQLKDAERRAKLAIELKELELKMMEERSS